MKTRKVLRFSVCSVSLTLCALFSAPASAASWFVSPQISTLGAGAQIGYRSDYDFSMRAAWNQYDFHKSFDVDSVKYHSEIKMKSMGLLFDYYPMNNGFHVTAGVYRNDNQIHGNGYLKGNFPVQYANQTFRIDGKSLGKVNAKVEYAPIAPYLGVGYHNVTKQGFSFTTDVGVFYQGSARATVSPPARLANSNDPRVKAGTDRQKRDLESKANKARWYPVISLGVAYTF